MHEDLARLPVVLAGDLERVLQRGADVRPEERLRILLDPVQVEGDRVEIARQVRQDERAAREADEADAVDVLRLVLEEGPDLLRRAREARRGDVVRAHRRGSIEHDDEILALVLRDPRRQLRLRARQREHERAAREQRQSRRSPASRAQRRAPRERAESRRDRRQAALAAQVEISDGAGGQQDRQDLPPRRELRAEEPHALAGPPRGLGARGGRPQQLHHLLRRGVRLLAELRRQPRGQLEVELRVPVVGRRFERLAEFFFGAAEPAEARLGRLFDDGLLEERARGPEVRRAPRPAPSARGRSPRRSASDDRARGGGCRPRGCTRPARSASRRAARRSAPPPSGSRRPPARDGRPRAPRRPP